MHSGLLSALGPLCRHENKPGLVFREVRAQAEKHQPSPASQPSPLRPPKWE